jgi:hypothetical protein
MTMRKKMPETMLTPDEWAQFQATQRLLATELARLEAARTPPEIDEEMRKRIAVRTEQILNEDPKERSERTMRMLAERIAYHEIRDEQRAAARAREERP